MDVFTLRKRVLDDYQAYIRSFLSLRDPDIIQRVETELAAGRLWPRPLVQINPAFEKAETLEELIANDILHPDAFRIFRDKPEPGIDRGPLHFYRHQADGIRAGRVGDSFVVTTGTGSGKSLSYIVPIVDHVLRERQRGAKRQIHAIIVYPMNALANSQKRELEKFLEHGFPDGQPPVTFRCFTGQEKDDERRIVRDDPPDILLTNFVMLELILTRQGERPLIAAAQGLRFLVLDELHTYRGRQGADVALLVRRVRQACRADHLVCIGTSATLAASGPWHEQQAEVARVASRIFGTAVQPKRVIGEVLRRRTAPLDLTDRAVITALRDRIRAGTSTDDPAALGRDPLTSWIESAMGLEDSKDGRLVRRTPRTLEAVAGELAAAVDLDVDTCAGAIAGMLLTKTSAGHPFFSLRLHQFLSKGNTVFATLEPEHRRHPTLSDQPVASDNRRLYPLVFCRECGQEYYSVGRRGGEDGLIYESRRRELAEDHTVEAGYLYLNTREPWPDAPDALYPRLPDTWFEHKNGPLRLRRDRQDDLPQLLHVAPDGSADPGGLRVHFIPLPVPLLPPVRRPLQRPRSLRLRQARHPRHRRPQHRDHPPQPFHHPPPSPHW